MTATKRAKDALKFVKNAGPDGVDALEFSLIQLALYDLHRQRGDIEKFVRDYKSDKKTRTSKLYRAIAKTYFATGKTPALVSKGEVRTQYWIDDYERQDGTPVTGHWRTLRRGESPPPGARTREHPADVQARTEEMRRASSQRSAEADARERWGGYQESRNAIGNNVFNWDHPEANIEFTGLEIGGPSSSIMDGPKKVYDAASSETTKQATKTYIQQQSAAEGVRAVADFFANKPGKFQFAWQAMSKFGPFTGARVAYNYYRYGGYDLPMRTEGGKVYTDLNDQIPAPESQEQTRAWAVDRLRDRLPTLATERTGSEPPSEGFIIDRGGNIVAHAVGRGNDFYLPFSMKHLRAMRNQDGVEYVRRRMIGGPTPEDFHIAMAMGADRFTTISNQGEFTVSLRNRAHGIKVEHFQIVERYQELMDRAENNKNLTLDRYHKMLSAMRDEFPLHIGYDRLVRNNNPEWVNKHDRVSGVDRLLDSLRDLFNVERQERRGGRGDSDRSASQPMQQRTRDEEYHYKKRFMQGIGRNESPYQYAQRVYKQQPSQKQRLMNELERYYRDKGQDVQTNSWYRDLFNLDHIDREKNPSDMTQPARPVRPPEDLETVTVRRVDPAENAPSQKVGINWGQYDQAPEILSQLGYDTQGYSRTQAAKKVVDTLERFDLETLTDFMEGPARNYQQLLDDLNANFRPL